MKNVRERVKSAGKVTDLTHRPGTKVAGDFNQVGGLFRRSPALIDTTVYMCEVLMCINMLLYRMIFATVTTT